MPSKKPSPSLESFRLFVAAAAVTPARPIAAVVASTCQFQKADNRTPLGRAVGGETKLPCGGFMQLHDSGGKRPTKMTVDVVAEETARRTRSYSTSSSRFIGHARSSFRPKNGVQAAVQRKSF